MLINQILNSKGPQVFKVAPDDTLSAVAALLHTRRVGAFIVADKAGKVVGIISERDIIRAIATEGPDALSLTVAKVMTKDVVSAAPGETVDTMLEVMTDRRIRHLPVMEGARLIGIVSIGDLVKARIMAAEHEAHSLRAYIAAG